MQLTLAEIKDLAFSIYYFYYDDGVKKQREIKNSFKFTPTV
ncbi:MAG: hypothetical protein HeimC3_35660 [Candidatus Heimdallarchaeota archaeon LC_3]|nr:MAG: hypothetical protein HeimC3_35660 [Candidatus Heimdallarchaeota archaeon LC_3]